MTEILRHPKAWKRYNRYCGNYDWKNELIFPGEGFSTEPDNLSDLKIYCRRRRPQPTILPQEIVLAVRLQKQKEQIREIIDRRIEDQIRRYIKLLSQPNQMTSQWRNYGHKHIDEIFTLSKNSVYLSHSI